MDFKEDLKLTIRLSFSKACRSRKILKNISEQPCKGQRGKRIVVHYGFIISEHGVRA